MLKNKTKNISKDLKVSYLKSFVEKTKGQMFLTKENAFYLKTRFGIHTFFVKFPLDIIILDKNNKVKNLKENLKPNRVFFWNPLYDTVLELPFGTIEKLKLEIGNNLEL